MNCQPTDTADAVSFDALIVPHRSLSHRSVWRVGLALVVVGTLIGLRFLLLGAWPVIAFSVSDVVILALLLALNLRQGRHTERILVGSKTFWVVRTDSRGRCCSRVLPLGWLRVVVQEQPGRTPRLLVSTRDVMEEIGAALGEGERRALADAIHAALQRAQCPSFDNPQLQSRAA
jgi:uncharacterized membrane protein